MPVLACRTITFAREAWVSGWPSSPKPPSMNTGPTCSAGSAPSTRSSSATSGGQVEEGAHELFVVGHLGDDDLGLAQQLDRSEREQARVTGATAHEGNPLQGAAPAPAAPELAGVLDVFCLLTFAFLLLRCFVDQVCCAVGEHFCGQLLPQPDGIVERTGGGPPYGKGAVGR